MHIHCGSIIPQARFSVHNELKADAFTESFLQEWERERRRTFPDEKNRRFHIAGCVEKPFSAAHGFAFTSSKSSASTEGALFESMRPMKKV